MNLVRSLGFIAVIHVWTTVPFGVTDPPERNYNVHLSFPFAALSFVLEEFEDSPALSFTVQETEGNIADGQRYFYLTTGIPSHARADGPVPARA